AVFQSLIEKHFPAPNRKKTLRLLGLDTSFFDDLGIKLQRNGSNQVLAVSNAKNEASSSKLHKDGVKVNNCDLKRNRAVKRNPSSTATKWSDDSNSDSEDKSESDFNISGTDEDESDDISSGVSEHESASMSEDSDIEPWDLYEQGKLKTKKRKRINKSSSKREKKQIRKVQRVDECKDLKAEFMSEQAGEICEKLRDNLLARLEEIGDRLPANTLDELIDSLGGSENVAEMTGRKGRVISNENGVVQYESRSQNDVPLEILNLTEKQRFMDDEKQIAIISEAASSGISLHSDRRVKNKKRRVHITIELPWSADRAIQQFGRTHRSNQVSAPEYVFIISDLAGELRFASIVAKRLESLGALTHGDRRATESRDLSKFNIDNKYGRSALEIVMKSIVRLEQPLVNAPSDYDGNFFEGIQRLCQSLVRCNIFFFCSDCRRGLNGVGIVIYENGLYSLD
ncbi:protein strawberry notch-like protein, partial [Leptotrombidium deliense]